MERAEVTPQRAASTCETDETDNCVMIPLLQASRTAAFAQPYAVSARYAAAKAEREAQTAGADAMLNAQKNKKPAFTEARDVRLICPECQEDPPDLIEEYSSGDLVCATCGLVVGDKIVDTRSECECAERASLCVAWRSAAFTFY